MKRHRILISTVTALIVGWLSAAEAQPVPSSAVAGYLVGRGYVNANGQGEVVGYFTDINGIFGSLFKGGVSQASENTAFFTARSDVFSVTPLPANGDIALFLVSAGTFDIYYNPNPNGDWVNPDSFSNGQLIGRFSRPESLHLQFDSFSFRQASLTGTLVSSRGFTFNGHRYDLRDIVPGGITFYESISNTPVPGVTGFPVGLPFAAHVVAVASEEQGER